jgi:hypothetical protein
MYGDGTSFIACPKIEAEEKKTFETLIILFSEINAE